MTNKEIFMMVFGKNPENLKRKASTIEWWDQEFIGLPSVNPQEPKTGHWTRELIRNEKGGCIGAKMICSECGNDNRHDEYMNYCPSCGVKMVESQESEKIETWNGIHAQITAPKGTFERIFNDADDDNDI